MKPYQKLIKKVARVDRNAAQYMRRRARKLGSFVECDCLGACFAWRETPQGKWYWHNINKQINGDLYDH